MAKNPTKEIGNKGNCYKCNGVIFCRGREYQGETKPQWQNQDGKAHYNGDGTCKDQTNPGIRQSVSSQVQETKVNWNILEEKTEDMSQLILGLDSMRSLAYEFTKSNHPELGENSNLFGQIVNANITHLIELALVKATKESS